MQVSESNDIKPANFKIQNARFKVLHKTIWNSRKGLVGINIEVVSVDLLMLPLLQLLLLADG